MAFLFANNINTTLAAAATSTQTTLSLTSTVGIPTTIPSGDYFAMTLNDAATRSVFEVVYVTAIIGSNVTVVRGQEGTTANSWLAGDYIYGALTAGELLAFANVAGSSTQPFAVAPASASAPQNAPQFGQMFDLQSPSASGSITLSALRTVVIPTVTSAITLTMEPGTIVGQSCEVIGTAYGVTVQSNVISGFPEFIYPDNTNNYSLVLSGGGTSALFIWDGANWHVVTSGQTVVGTAESNNQAVSLGQANAIFAALAGNLNQNFAAALLSAATGNFSGNVTAAAVYSDTLLDTNNNSALVLNSGNTASTDSALTAYIPHACAPATNNSEAVTLGQFTSSRTVGGPVIMERPDGLIFQFGTGTVTASGTGNFSNTINLPEAFPNAGLFAIGNWGGTNPPGGGSAFPFTTPTTTQVTLGVYAPGAGTFTIAYLAVGY